MMEAKQEPLNEYVTTAVPAMTEPAAKRRDHERQSISLVCTCPVFDWTRRRSPARALAPSRRTASHASKKSCRRTQPKQRLKGSLPPHSYVHEYCTAVRTYVHSRLTVKKTSR